MIWTPYLHPHPISELLELARLVELQRSLVSNVGLCGDSRIKEGTLADVFHRLLLQLLSELLSLLGSNVCLFGRNTFILTCFIMD